MQVDNVKDLDTVMPTYNLIEHSDNYSWTAGSLYQHHKDEPTYLLILKHLNLKQDFW